VEFRYPIGYHAGMDAATTLQAARSRARLSLRALARRAGTSHSTLAAYESRRKVPSVETLERIVRAAGYELRVEVSPAVGGSDREARGRELIEVLDLAAMFPARHARTLAAPRFGAA
jgi:transcriptional regulator with XRE-family HTH domain